MVLSVMAVDGVIYAAQLGPEIRGTGAERVREGRREDGNEGERAEEEAEEEAVLGRLLERRIFMPGVMRDSVSVDGN